MMNSLLHKRACVVYPFYLWAGLMRLTGATCVPQCHTMLQAIGAFEPLGSYTTELRVL